MRHLARRLLLACAAIALMTSSQLLTASASEKPMDDAQEAVKTMVEEVTPAVLLMTEDTAPLERPEQFSQPEHLEIIPQEPETEVAKNVEHLESIIYYQPGDDEELVRIAEVEYRGCTSAAHIAAVMWTVLNRVDSPAFKEQTVHDVIYASGQFAVRGIGHVPRRDDWLWIAQDVLERWNAEKNGLVDVNNSGRVIPPDSVYFWGDGRYNHFNNGATEYAIDTQGSPYGY